MREGAVTTQNFAVFETAIGTAAVAWGPRGIIGSHLPEPTPAEARAHMRRRFPDATESPPPKAVQAVIDDVVALMKGESKHLLDADLDMEGIPDFHKRVYEVARAIPPGETLTYGDVAEKLNAPGAARAVGQALGANRFPPIVPCHRILGAGGKTGGFTARGGTTTKMRLLNLEGAKVNEKPFLFADLPLAAPPRKRKPRGH
jgi:methylated-DNA-[protein]-cysteine S-methyltransferase